MKDLCVRCWKPRYERKPHSYALRGVLAVPYSNFCQEGLYTQTCNIQINGKIHRNSLPKLEAEIMRAMVPIPLIFLVKSKFSLLQDSTER